jgi:cytochrome d ubiquinol oxidase subunit I
LFVIEMSLMVKYIRKGPFQDVDETNAWQARHEERLRAEMPASSLAATPAE